MTTIEIDDFRHCSGPAGQVASNRMNGPAGPIAAAAPSSGFATIHQQELEGSSGVVGASVMRLPPASRDPNSLVHSSVTALPLRQDVGMVSDNTKMRRHAASTSVGDETASDQVDISTGGGLTERQESRSPESCYPLHLSHRNNCGHHAVTNHDPANHSTIELGMLLELVIPVAMRFHGLDEGVRSLGICLRLERGGAHGVSRVLIARLTDPTDPFFLFEMELTEEDYSAFKQKLELVVDFNGFPKFLVGMLQSIQEGTVPYQVTFTAQGSEAARGVLRIVEVTAFRTIEHLSLILIRQGDSGQKKHLAERFQFFESAYKKCYTELQEVRQQLNQALQEVSSERDDLAEKYRVLTERHTLTDAQRESQYTTMLSDLQRQRETEQKQQSDAHSAEIKELQERFTSIQQQLLSDLRTKDESLQQLQEKFVALESAHTQLTSEHRVLESKSSIQSDELHSMRQMNEELNKMRLEAVENITHQNLSHATLTERLNGANITLESKQQEIDTLKEQNEKHSACISSLTAQNDQLSSQVQTLEKNLAKAHYIISNQLQSMNSTKDRYKIAMEQIRTQEQLLEERQAAIRRGNDTHALLEDKLSQSDRKVTELQEQLKKTSLANETLSTELQQLRDALVQVQKSTSGMAGSYLGRRYLPSPSAGMGFARTSAYQHPPLLGASSTPSVASALHYPSHPTTATTTTTAASTWTLSFPHPSSSGVLLGRDLSGDGGRTPNYDAARAETAAENRHSADVNAISAVAAATVPTTTTAAATETPPQRRANDKKEGYALSSSTEQQQQRTEPRRVTIFPIDGHLSSESVGWKPDIAPPLSSKTFFENTTGRPALQSAYFDTA